MDGRTTLARMAEQSATAFGRSRSSTGEEKKSQHDDDDDVDASSSQQSQKSSLASSKAELQRARVDALIQATQDMALNIAVVTPGINSPSSLPLTPRLWMASPDTTASQEFSPLCSSPTLTHTPIAPDTKNASLSTQTTASQNSYSKDQSEPDDTYLPPIADYGNSTPALTPQTSSSSTTSSIQWEKVQLAEERDDDYVPIADYTCAFVSPMKPRRMTTEFTPDTKISLSARTAVARRNRKKRQQRRKRVRMVLLVGAGLLWGWLFLHQKWDFAFETVVGGGKVLWSALVVPPNHHQQSQQQQQGPSSTTRHHVVVVPDEAVVVPVVVQERNHADDDQVVAAEQARQEQVAAEAFADSERKAAAAEAAALVAAQLAAVLARNQRRRQACRLPFANILSPLCDSKDDGAHSVPGTRTTAEERHFVVMELLQTMMQ
jgi:hypothetical protein